MMSKVAIVTDSIACLTKEEAEHYGIRIVPANILFEGKVYRDWVDISPSEAYRFLEKDPERFTTSPASPVEYLEAYRELGNRAQSILCITVSDGVVRPAAVARTKERGVDRLLQMMGDKVGTNPVHVAVMHADALEEPEKLKEQVSSEFNCIELWLSEFSPIMGYATGPGLLGLAFYAEA